MSQGFGQDWQNTPSNGPGWGSQPPPQWGSQPPQRRQAGQADGMRRLDLGDILDGMFRLVVRHWRPLLLALAPVLLPVNALAVFFSERATGSVGLIEAFQNPALAEAQTLRPGDLAPLFAVGVLSGVLVSPYVYGVCVTVAARGARGEPIGVGALMRAALRRYPALFGVYLCVFLTAALAFAPGAGLLAAGAVGETPPLAIVAALALLAALPAALAVVVFFSLALPAAVEERVGPLRALRRSVQLVRGRFWRTLGIVLLAYLITNVVSMVIALPFGLPATLVGGPVGAVFTGLGGTLSSLLSTPLLAAALTLLYLDARVRREGLDLERMMEGLG